MDSQKFVKSFRFVVIFGREQAISLFAPSPTLKTANLDLFVCANQMTHYLPV